MLADSIKLCLVTQVATQPFSTYKQFLQKVIEAGVTSVQLRYKTQDENAFYDWANALKSWLSPLNIPLIINDHVEVAIEIDADGVHVGQSEASPHIIRKLLGHKKIIGLSIETMDELRVANKSNDINYVAASAVFPSKTKRDCKTIWGLEGLQRIVSESIHPVIGIGGINETNIHSVMSAGAFGVAVVSAIHDHPFPEKITTLLIEEIHRHKKEIYVRTHV